MEDLRNVAQSFGMSEVFVGVIVLAVIGNSAEQSSAILMAMRNRMDLALSIAIGSSIQIALGIGTTSGRIDIRPRSRTVTTPPTCPTERPLLRLRAS